MSKNVQTFEPNSNDIRREYRTAISALSFFGGLETGYLTVSKLGNQPDVNSLCGGPSCGSVLSSPFATIPILNVPLTAIGVLAYSAVFFLSVAPLISKMDEKRLEGNAARILFLSAAMATFSCYLIGVLTFILHESCTYW